MAGLRTLDPPIVVRLRVSQLQERSSAARALVLQTSGRGVESHRSYSCPMLI